MERIGKKLLTAACFLAAFALWTAALCFVDVQAIGAQGTAVGLAGVNRFIHGLTGVHPVLYTITDWLGLVPAGVCMGFGAFGLVQWVKRKDIRRVDRNILALGGLYGVVIAAYLFFERFVINYRPVLIHGVLEASYPSSTTLLVLCVMPTAGMQLRNRIRNKVFRRWLSALITAFTALMVIGRLVSGVHWVSDIIGGALLSAGLVAAYDAACCCLKRRD